MSEVQEMHRLHKPAGYGKDGHGEFETIPLSMVRGGKTKPFKVYTDPIRHILNSSAPVPRGWYKDKTPESNRIRPRPCYTEAILTTPYGGFCPINCAHCYINNGTRGYRATGIPTVNPEYPEYMRRKIDKIMIGSAGYITSFSEPFHPLEDTYHITQQLSQVFVGAGLPIFYLSRKLAPDWAIDNLLHNPYSYMQWSINTSNNDHYRRFSPGSFDLDDVLDQILEMSDEGIYISIQCNPIIAGITTLTDLKYLCDLVAEAGGHHIIFKFVEQVANNRKIIVERMHQRKLPHVDTFDNLFNQVLGGVYTIQEDVRIEWLTELLTKTREVGLTMGLCYEYYDDGYAGSNMAPWFTTADQCHGRGIPVFYRPEPGAPFELLPGCYRKGCLYCKEHGTRICRNEKLLDATALTYKDLRYVRLVGDIDNWEMPKSCAPPRDASMYLDIAPLGNPGLITDAEMWGWPNLEDL